MGTCVHVICLLFTGNHKHIYTDKSLFYAEVELVKGINTVCALFQIILDLLESILNYCT